MQRRLNSLLHFSEGKPNGFSDLLNMTFEYVIFFRWAFFKNRPRGNLLFIRAVLIVSFYFAIFTIARHDIELILLGVDFDPILIFGAAVVFGYWKMTDSFYSKSEACNKTYLEFLRADESADTSSVEITATSLAIDLMVMDLWAHRKYCRLFSRTLDHAVGYFFSLPPEARNLKDLPQSEENFIQQLNMGKTPARIARLILDEYLEHLVELKKQSSFRRSTVTKAA